MARQRLDPESTKEVRIAIRIPADMKADFDAYCLRGDTTMSLVIRELVRAELVRDQRRRDREPRAA